MLLEHTVFSAPLNPLSRCQPSITPVGGCMQFVPSRNRIFDAAKAGKETADPTFLHPRRFAADPTNILQRYTLIHKNCVLLRLILARYGTINNESEHRTPYKREFALLDN